MAVKFIIGRAGTGKTRHCFDQIVTESRNRPLGPPIYWLLPKQATFQAERHLVCDSGLPALCRVLVLSFSQLGDLVTQQCGGIAIPQIGPAGRQMILGHLLRQHQTDLRFFRSVARQPGLAAQLDFVFDELERYGKSADEILKEISGNRTDDPHAAKFHDLNLLYGKYTAYLGQERLDQHQRLKQVVDCIGDWAALKHATIYVDGFFDFAQQERRLLAALAQGCAKMEITLLFDPASPVLSSPRQPPALMSLFHRTEQTYRRLHEAFAEQSISIDAPLLLREPMPGAAPSIQRAQRHLFDRATGNGSDSQGIHLIQAPSRRAEIDAVARHIRGLLNTGHRLRDIAVLARDLTPYHDLIAARFAEHDIPCFIDARRSAAHHPLVRFARFLPALAANQWPHDTVMGLLKTGLTAESTNQIDELENFVLAHRIRGKAWTSEMPWSFSRHRTGDEDGPSEKDQAEIERVDKLRRETVALFQPLANLLSESAPLPVSRIVAEINALFERAHLRDTVNRWIADAEAVGEFEQAAAHEQIWTALTKLLDQMVDLLGPDLVTPAEFTDILETGLERFDLALTPPTVDQVLVGTLDRTRTPALKAVILIGWHDGGFPHRPAAGGILSDIDREQMNVGGDSLRLLLDERFLAYFAVTRATDHVCITRPCADDDGKELAPSPFWARIENLFPDAPRTIVHKSCEEDCIGTLEQLATALMRWARDPAASADESTPWPALYQWFATSPANEHALDRFRDRAWPALRYSNQATLFPAIAARLFTAPLSARIGRIESFAACPFQHFASYGLVLHGRPEPDVTGLDLGRIYHAVLENVVGDMLRTRRDWAEDSPRTAGLIQSQTRAIGQQLRDEIMLSSARNQYLLDRVGRTLEQVMAAQEAAIRRGMFRPANVDVRFGEDAALPALSLTTPAGKRIDLSGKIDRVDTLSTPKGNYASVVDYRTGSQALATDRVYHGLSLQLLTYLLVLEANGTKLAGHPITPAAAFYVRLLRQLEDVRHPNEAIGPEDPRFDLQVKPRGIFESRFVKAFDSTLVNGASDVVQVYVNKDGKIGRKQSSDTAEQHELTALLRLVEQRIGEMVDRLLAGDISATPYRIRNESPCARCDFRSVCRFDPAINRYRILEPLSKEEVFSRITNQPE